jgi:isopentenyl phosphate kinase
MGGRQVAAARRRAMSDQEHEQQSEETSEEREETMKDLEVPEEEGKDVTGGLGSKVTFDK